MILPTIFQYYASYDKKYINQYLTQQKNIIMFVI